MSELIDTTEMYLRTVFELVEEGIVPLRARIAERLRQSGPTVSQTVSRMERDGLLRVTGSRSIELSDLGRTRATRVMRKHRLAERLLTDVIGLDWELVHDEACRWEHVISEEVESRLVHILSAPVSSPYGNPIPGLAELGFAEPVEDFRSGTKPIPEVLPEGTAGVRVELRRIGERLQSDAAVLRELRRCGILPGVPITATASESGVRLVADGPECQIGTEESAQLFVVAS